MKENFNIDAKISILQRLSSNFGWLVTLLSGCVISILAFVVIQDFERTKLQREFNEQANNRLAALQTDMIRQQEIVISIASLFSSSSSVTRSQFKIFVQDALTRRPNIQALGWNPLIVHSQKQDYIERARLDGFDDFQFKNMPVAENSIAPDESDDAVVVYFIEPYLGNEKALGFNIASHRGRLDAIYKARDTGLAIISEPIELVQKIGQGFGFLLFKAVYRNGIIPAELADKREQFIGVATGVFNFKEWMPASLRDISPIGMDIWILDQTNRTNETVLHFHSSRTRDETFKPTLQDIHTARKNLHWEEPVQLMGRRWSYLFSAAPKYLEVHRPWLAWTMMVIGLLISMLLSFYLFSRARNMFHVAQSSRQLLREIAERKKHEADLKAQFNFTNTVLNGTSNLIVVLDLNGCFKRFNRAAEIITGYSATEVLDNPIWESVIQSEHIGQVKKEFHDLRSGLVEVDTQYENEWESKDGKVITLQWNATSLQNEEDRSIYIVAMGYDITEINKNKKEQQRLERELHQAQKMDSLGKLTGGIAHDFNNLLGIINGYSSLVSDKLENRDEGKLVGYLKHIIEAGERAAKLVSQMLSFSRSLPVDELPIDFESLVVEDIKMIRATLPSSIKIKTEIESGLPYVQLSAIHLHQIIMNLAINARDAMQGAGILTIKVGWIKNLDTVSPISHKAVKGDWIQLSICDTGSGVQPEIIHSIFNPFFTTKEVGEGTGMGLSVVYGIMEGCSGHLLLNSELGKGSCFQMLFPPSVKANHDLITQQKGLSLDDLKINDLEILVVDDEQSLGNFMTELVMSYGFKTIFVQNSREALALFKKQPNRFFTLITDQTMPNLTGIELIEEIRKIRPQFPAILCSGFSDKIDSLSAKKKDVTYLEKPINQEKLLEILRELTRG